MAKALYLAPTGFGVGLTSVTLGLFRALDRVGLRVGFCKPIAQPHESDKGPDRSTRLLRPVMDHEPPEPLDPDHARQLFSDGETGRLMEDIVQLYESAAEDHDVVLVEGLVQTRAHGQTGRLNAEIAKTLDADVILVAVPGRIKDPAHLEDRIEIAGNLFGGLEDPRLIGCILNKIDAPVDESGRINPHLGTVAEQGQEALIREKCKIFDDDGFRLLGCIPWAEELVAPRTGDIAEHLGAKVINAGRMHERRAMHVSLSARTARNMCANLRAGTLVVTPGDRDDIIMASCMAAMNGMPLAGLLLTGGMEPDSRIMQLAEPALQDGLPVLCVETNSYQTITALNRMNPEVPVDDRERLEAVMDSIAARIDAEWLKDKCGIQHEPRLSPPAFRYQLVKRANRADKRIVLPEGDEPRTVRAAAMCQSRGIARCVLIGRPDAVRGVAQAQGVELPEGLEIVDPEEVRADYVEPMVELRKHKGLNAPMAEAQLEDNVVLATMMLARDEVDGLVSGAVHTTANTIRPALQLIKTSDNARIVSSVFFMCLPEQVLVYGDCAVNPDPDAEELADIAIQSADSAVLFGITPRVAMISYSTGESGSGSDVEKVREATRIAAERRPDLELDGPLQYDAAVMENVARSKAPDSVVAGRATVLIFPDLNTGNTTYKAVQRSANVVSIGPMLQGLRKPVNDLSRGALVEDIVYTIALTAIQAAQADEAGGPTDGGES